MSASSASDRKRALAEELGKDTIDYDRVFALSSELIASDVDNVRFSVDARILHKLGYELVGKQETALGELIKNAYDADATLVTAQYSNVDNPGGTLVIKDNGVGMTEDRIRNAWMRLSTGDKVVNPISPKFGRSRAGRKGIGRLAVERLGKKLLLMTGVEGEPHRLVVRFDWEKALNEGGDLGAISFKIEKTAKDPRDYGTTLVIEDLRDRWTESMLKRVWASVVFLQTPFRTAEVVNADAVISLKGSPYAKDPGFHVEINGKSGAEAAKEFSIEKSFLDLSLAKISGVIAADGTATAFVDSTRLNLSDSQRLDGRFLTVGELKFEANYFIYRSDLLPGVSLKTAVDLGGRYGGIRVYRNGFRVLPYGEQSDDWLKLAYDVARRNILSPVNNNNLFGHVEIDLQANPFLEETSSREGLIENEAFDELRTFIRSTIEWAAHRVASLRETKNTAGQKDWKKKEKPSEALKTLIETAEPSPDSNESETSSGDQISISKSALLEAVSEQRSFEASVEADVEKHIRYEEMLRILASMGISISVFSHEIGGALNGVSAALELFKDKFKSDDGPANETVSAVDANMQRLRDLSGYINSLIGYAGSRDIKPVALNAVVKSFIGEFSTYLNAKSISFEYGVDPPFLRTRPMHRSEIDSVLFNFLTNAVKAIGRNKAGSRRIKIDAFRSGNSAVIRFQDTGDGVPEENRDRIFDAFFTTTSYDPEEPAGTGTGLGLRIVGDIASANGGTVQLGVPEHSFASSFEFSVPVDSGQKGS